MTDKRDDWEKPRGTHDHFSEAEKDFIAASYARGDTTTECARALKAARRTICMYFAAIRDCGGSAAWRAGVHRRTRSQVANNVSIAVERLCYVNGCIAPRTAGAFCDRHQPKATVVSAGSISPPKMSRLMAGR